MNTQSLGGTMNDCDDEKTIGCEEELHLFTLIMRTVDVDKDVSMKTSMGLSMEPLGTPH
jgi:hypothetical protein